jgi:hypothetical protein
LNKLFQNTQHSCNNGDKFLVLQLQNPVDKTDILDLQINLKDTTIANAWFDQCVKCLDQKLHVEKNFCSKCGEKLQASAKFCSGCGTVV